MKKNLIALFLILAIMSASTMALASDISGALYHATILSSNNSTITTNVATIMTLDSQYLVDTYLADDDFSDVAIRNSSGSDMAFMPSATITYPWAMWVPSIGTNQVLGYDLFTGGNTTGGKLRYFPGTGGMTTADHETLELGTDFAIEQKGMIDVAVGDDANLVYKEDAIKVYAASGSILADILGPSANKTFTIDPNAAGDYTNIANQVGAGAHWEIVIDDDDATYVHDNNVAEHKDVYNLDPFTPTDIYEIGQVEVYYRWQVSGGTSGTVAIKPYLRLGTDETAGTGISSAVNGTWVEESEVLARPGGGSWITTDLATLQAGVGIQATVDRNGWVSEVWVVVTYTAPIADATVLAELDNDLLNGNFETGDPPSDWSTGALTFTRSSEQSYAGSYSGKLVSDGIYGYIYQDTLSGASLAGKTVSVSIRVWCPSANDKEQVIWLVDDAGSETSGTLPKNDQWHLITLSKEIDPAATYVRLQALVNNSAVADTDDVMYVDVASLAVQGESSAEHTIKVEQEDNTGASWLAGGWDNRIEWSIDHTKVDSDLTYFPVRISLSTTAGMNSEDVTAIFDELGAESLKIAITEDDGVTELYGEIEDWDEVGEEAEIWTSGPGWVIDNDVDTGGYLYFDADHADNTAYVSLSGGVAAQSVWNANYVLVDHKQDGADNQHTYDSTSNNYDGTKGAAAEPTEAIGKIGEAQDFDGADDEINYGNPAGLQITEALTIEAIVNANSSAVGTARLFTGKDDGVNECYRIWIHDSNYAYFSFWTGGVKKDCGTNAIITHDEYFHLAGTYNKITAIIYKDGVAQADVEAVTTSIDNDAANVWAGERGGTSLDFTGLIDEIRISNTARSAAWLKATYYSSWDNLIDFVPYDADYMVELPYDLRISVDGVVQDRQLGVAVPPNDNGWTFFENNVMPYIEYHDIEVDGVEVQHIEWEYDTTFTDSSAQSNDATPTFRTASSDADVSATLIDFLPITQAVSSATPSTSWGEMLPDAPDMPSTTYTEESRPGIFFERVVHDLLSISSIPDSIFWYNFCFVTIILAGMLVYRAHPSLVIKAIVMGAIMIFWALPGPNVYGMYTVIYFVMGAFGLIVISRSYGL